MMRSFMNRQFLGFLLTGGLAAAVNFGSRILYNRWLDFSSAVVLAYLTGMVTAFILARSFVFTQGSQSVQRSAMFFVLVNGVAVLQTWAISMALYYLLPIAGVTKWVPEIAHAVGVAAPVFTSYLGHKKFSFR
jgi:putative flippase GtrA